MKLKQIKLQNYRMHKDLTIDVPAEGLEIVEPNYWGKSTVANSILDCLTGKPLTGEKNYSQKPIINGEEVHGVDSSVILAFDNGTTLKKTLKENWEKKRGSIEKTYTGNSYTYEVNGVPALKKEFDSFINEKIATTEQIQSLFNPQWWCENKPDGYGWEKRRETLLQMLGSVNEDQLLTDELVAVLNGNQPEDAKKVYKSAMKKINEQIKNIPTSVEENQLKINNIEKVDVSELTAQIQLLENEKAEAHKRIAEMSSEGEQERSLRTAYLDAQEELTKARTEYNSDRAVKLEEANRPILRQKENITLYSNEASSKDLKMKNLKNRMEELEKKLEACKEKKQKLLTEYHEVKIKEYQPGSMFCPACNQPLPKDQVEQAASNYNKAKSEKLLTIQEQGKANNVEIEQLEKTLITTKDDYETSAQGFADAENRYNEECDKFDKMSIEKVEILEFEQTETFKKLSDTVVKANENMSNVPDKSVAIEPYKQLIQTKTEEQQALQTKIANYESIEQHKARITELTEESKRLSKEYAQAEKALYLIEQYQIARIKLLDDSVNEKFKTLRFRMFKPNIGNDGIQDCCDVLINSKNSGLVAYQSASTSEKIIANFELIEALSSYWKIELPIIVDNAEAIQKENRPRTDKQIIWLEVEQK